MKQVFLYLTLLVLCVPATSAAVELYSDAGLSADKDRYTRRFEFLLKKGLTEFMTPDERRAVQDLVLWHKLRGAGPLSFKSVTFEGRPTIIAPLMSIKFIEDLSLAYAWRYQNGYSLEPIDEYLVMLKHRPAERYPDGRAPSPLDALGVPPRVWERDRKVDELSLRFRNTAWAFILAHEIAHVRFGHTLTDASPAEIQRQEELADQFAVDLLGRSGTIPMGMILWFQASAGYMKNRSDFSSDAAYFNWLASEAEHPVNGRRLRSLAGAMQRQADSARDPARGEVLEFIATRLATIGATIEDPEMQQFLKRCATSRRLDDLKRLEDRPCL